MSGRWADAFARVPTLLAAHVELCLAALVLAILVSVPLSIWASRSERVAGVVLTIASIVQTIPTLALLALFYPLLLALRFMVALAAGTFIYIAALDLIRDEFLRPGSAWVKWCWTALGLVFMSLLAFWI